MKERLGLQINEPNEDREQYIVLVTNTDIDIRKQDSRKDFWRKIKIENVERFT